jgi:tRNA(Ile)-lysidine synthetase-like protein
VRYRSPVRSIQDTTPREDVATTVRRVRRLLDDADASLVGRSVLALCSGGADSVALVALLASLPRGAAPARIDVLWLDHRLRSDVDAERAAARDVADATESTFHERRAGSDLGSRSIGGIEDAARTWRYEQATELAVELGCDVVCTGHTASDQVEQALLSLAAITGRPGAAEGMPVERALADGVTLVRPLLALTRADVERACDAASLEWAVDPTNLDADAHRRNTIRHEVVAPLLDVAPAAGAALARAATRRRDEAGVAPALAEALLDAWEAAPDRLDVRRVARLPAPARRAVVAAWLARADLGRSLTSRTVAAVEQLAVAPARAACSRVDLGRGACVRRDGYDLCITHVPAPGGTPP